MKAAIAVLLGVLHTGEPRPLRASLESSVVGVVTVNGFSFSSLLSSKSWNFELLDYIDWARILRGKNCVCGRVWHLWPRRKFSFHWKERKPWFLPWQLERRPRPRGGLEGRRPHWAFLAGAGGLVSVCCLELQHRQLVMWLVSLARLEEELEFPSTWTYKPEVPLLSP